MSLEGSDVILAALAAGTGAGISDVAKGTVTQTWTSLCEKVRAVFVTADDQQAAMALDLFKEHPQELSSVLRGYLETYGLGSDPDVLSQSQSVLEASRNMASGPHSIAATVLNVTATHGGVAGGTIGSVDSASPSALGREGPDTHPQ